MLAQIATSPSAMRSHEELFAYWTSLREEGRLPARAHINPDRFKRHLPTVSLIDVLDPRHAGYSFTLPDVAADNASGAGFLVGAEGVEPSGFDLRLTGVVLSKNGELVATATGAEVLGHPAASVAWLVRALAARGRGLSAGQVVLSGALTAAVAVAPGDVITAEFDRVGAVELTCG